MGEIVFSGARSFVRLASSRTALAAFFAIAVAVSSSAPAARADTIASNFSAGFSTAGSAFGQSVTTPGGGPWNNLIFNFYDISANPYASGSLYLLNHEYLGTPASLSSEANLGVGTAASGTWTFDASVVLQPNTQYWFYMDTSSGGTALLVGAGNPYSGGVYYRSDSGTNAYTIPNATQDTAFLLQGTESVPLPIPGAGLLSYLLVGFGGLAAFRKKLRARAGALLAMLRVRRPDVALLKRRT